MIAIVITFVVWTAAILGLLLGVGLFVGLLGRDMGGRQ